MQDLALFSVLSPAERKQVTLIAGKKTYQKGEVIFCEGDQADTIYLIKMQAGCHDIHDFSSG